MPDVAKRPNSAALWAVLFAMGALAANFVFFVHPPLQSALPWIGLAFAVLAVFASALTLARAFGRPQIYRAKALSTVLAVLALIIGGANLFIFYHARALPDSTAAPQVGQHVPDFTMPDTSGQSVALDSLFAPASAEPSSAAPKAVLLIFYRGYW
jgi:hypothetical protein